MITKEYDVLNDLTKITSIPTTVFYKFVDCACQDITHCILENVNNVDTDVLVFDIGIGQLSCKVTQELIKYKFIPSVKLELMIYDSVKDNKSPLIESIDEALVKRVLNLYQELL